MTWRGSIMTSGCLFLAVSAVLLSGCGDGNYTPLPPKADSQAGTSLFTLPMPDGNMVRVRGPVALFFFTSWCVYCKQLLPETRKLTALARTKGWNVYGIDVQEPLETAGRYEREHKPGMPVLVDQTGRLASRLGVEGYPTFILIDAQGKILYKEHDPPKGL